MAKRKAPAKPEGATLEERAGEGEPKYGPMSFEHIEKVFHEGTYKQFEKDVQGVLDTIKGQYAKEGRITKGELASATDVLMDKLADIILLFKPEDLAGYDLESIKAELESRGINHRQMKLRLTNLDFSNLDQLKGFIDDIVNGSKSFWQERGRSSLQQHYEDPEGRARLKGHVEGRGDFKFSMGENYQLDHALAAMSTYINMPGVYEEGEIVPEKTRLPLEQLHALGPEIIEGWEENIKPKYEDHMRQLAIEKKGKEKKQGGPEKKPGYKK